MLKNIICTLGQYDIPIIQMQPPFSVDLLDSNIAVFGSSMNGKTNFLRLLINILHKKMDEKSEQIFILDFGGALAGYEKYPLVSAYFDNSNEEYVKRIFKILENVLNDNIKQLDGKIYRNATENQPVHTTFIIDNLNAFINEDRYSAYHEKFARLCRDGSSKGISIIFTATELKGVNQYLLSFKQKVALNMPVDTYTDIFSSKVEMAGNVPGRGYANVTVAPKGVTGTFQMNNPYEVQCYLADDIDNEEAEFVKKLRTKYEYINNGETESNPYDEEYGRHVSVRYKKFPQELLRYDYDKLKQSNFEGKEISPNEVEVGLDYVKCQPVTVDFKKSRVLAIYGKKEFGKTNLLSMLLEGVTDQLPNARYVFFDDGRKQLDIFYRKYKGLVDCMMIDQFKEQEITYNQGGYESRPSIRKKLSPIQQFYMLIHNEYMDLKANYIDLLESVYGRVYEEDIPSGIGNDSSRPTVFIIQSKSIYLNSKINADFLHYILPELLDVAEDRNYIFIFSDVQKITDTEVSSIFNSTLKSIFVLDNIAEFASERGSRTVFGDMDIKGLKEEFAQCEKGDGYYYDVEADSLIKLKFIKNDLEEEA